MYELDLALGNARFVDRRVSGKDIIMLSGHQGQVFSNIRNNKNAFLRKYAPAHNLFNECW